MAKGLFGMGGGAPRTTNNGSPGGVRPMPRPVAGAEPAAGAQPGFLGRFLGPQSAAGMERRTDMAMEMLRAAMSSAGSSGSPALQFLTPILSSVIGSSLATKNDQAKASQASAMTDSVLGPNGMSPAAKRALDVMNNPNSPDFLRRSAEKFLQNLAKDNFENGPVPIDSASPRPAARSTGGANGAATPAPAESAAGVPAPKTRVFGTPFEINGFLYQRDAYGNAVPMRGPDGQNVPVTGGKSSSRPAEPAAPAADDPLGLRTPPAANPLELP